MGAEGWTAAAVLTVWLLGIVVVTARIASYTPEPDIQRVLDQNPTAFLLLLTLLIVIWPIVTLGISYSCRNQTPPR
jgi:uncharacterized membrane protein YecN with MAPEG domain